MCMYNLFFKKYAPMLWLFEMSNKTQKIKNDYTQNRFNNMEEKYADQ